MFLRWARFGPCRPFSSVEKVRLNALLAYSGHPAVQEVAFLEVKEFEGTLTAVEKVRHDALLEYARYSNVQAIAFVKVQEFQGKISKEDAAGQIEQLMGASTSSLFERSLDNKRP